jgi:hypothetical protein
MAQPSIVNNFYSTGFLGNTGSTTCYLVPNSISDTLQYFFFDTSNYVEGVQANYKTASNSTYDVYCGRFAGTGTKFILGATEYYQSIVAHYGYVMDGFTINTNVRSPAIGGYGALSTGTITFNPGELIIGFIVQSMAYNSVEYVYGFTAYTTCRPYATGNKCGSCVTGYSGTLCDVWSCYGVLASSSSTCAGNGICTGPSNCTCNTGYSGSNCDNYTCNGVAYNSTSVCSSHGTCTSYNTCICNSNRLGSNCEYSPNPNCIRGYVGNDCTIQIPGVTPCFEAGYARIQAEQQGMKCPFG